MDRTEPSVIMIPMNAAFKGDPCKLVERVAEALAEKECRRLEAEAAALLEAGHSVDELTIASYWNGHREVVTKKSLGI